MHDDRGLFEMLILEGALAGPNWETILKKRESYRAAFMQAVGMVNDNVVECLRYDQLG